MPRGRGGYQKPANPAPSSPPGALSRRTDGGPANPTPQAAPGQGYGGRAVQDELIAAHPDGAPGSQVVPNGATAAQPAGGFAPQNIFAPTERPNEPITAGLNEGMFGSTQLNTQEQLKAIYSVHPDPWIMNLIDMEL